MFSTALEATLHRSVGLAVARKHSYTTLEHLLLALTDDPDASAVLAACKVDLARLKRTLIRYIDDELLSLVQKEEDGQQAPTAGFHRVVQRAAIHVQSSGRSQVTGANILVAMFSEAESHARFFLSEQGMTRHDAVNFIAHGISKGDAAA
jgi:ATP-dependent Clp protease ATP-binding subunit ClpA